MDNSKYYVFLTNYMGMGLEDASEDWAYGKFNTLKEASEAIDYAVENILEPDEAVYLYHHKQLMEIY